jgi:bifunctional non-homologous end joining protein LigD
VRVPVRLSSPDKVLWPEPGLTKRDLWDHVHAVADRLLPHLRDRPLSVRRFPRGVGARGFFQKDLPDHAPDTIRRWRHWADSAGHEVAYALVDDVDDLAWFAQQNTIEFHPAVAPVSTPDRPDRLVLDLDPGERDVPLGRMARWSREVLRELGVDPFVTTTGGRGVHVIVPIEPTPGQRLRPLTLAIARMVADRHPEDLTVEMRRAGREGRTLVDWSRSTPGATLIAPWSPRATPTATVATPLDWDEVDDGLDPGVFTLTTVRDRPDPWGSPQHWHPRPVGPVREAVTAAGYDLVDASPRGVTADYLDTGD